MDVTNNSVTVNISYRGVDATGIIDGNVGYGGNYVGSNFARITHKTVNYSLINAVMFNLTSGTHQDGIWTAVATIPQNSLPGDYWISIINPTDRNGIKAASTPNGTLEVK